MCKLLVILEVNDKKLIEMIKGKQLSSLDVGVKDFKCKFLSVYENLFQFLIWKILIKT